MEGNEGVPAVEQLVDAVNNDEEEVRNEEERVLVVAAAPAVGRTRSHFEHVLSKGMIYLLEFMDLPSQIQLASASTTLSGMIYHQFSSLWETIELSRRTLPNETIELITDDVLATLFHRVDAQTVTKILIIKKCWSISEHCLEPLRHSQKMERVFWNWSRVDVDIAASINVLRTMLRYNLTEVMLPLGRTPAEDEVRQRFLHEVRQAVHQRAIDQGTECTACRHPVRDASRQIAPDDHGLPLTRCRTCLKNFCRTGPCPMEMRDCGVCGVASCGDCDNVKQCDKCHETLCSECRTFSGKCIYCNKQFCWLMCGGDEITCELCEKTVCAECSENHDNVSVYECDGCREYHCTDCDERLVCSCCNSVGCGCKHAQCSLCMTTLCSDCTSQEGSNVWKCHVCESGFCGDCRQFIRCACQVTLCSQDCMLSHFNECEAVQSYQRARTEGNNGGALP